LKRQYLVGIPRSGQLLERADFVERDRSADGPGEGRVEDRRLIQEGLGVGTELGTDVVDVGHEAGAGLAEDVQQGMTIEVDPDEGAGDTLVTISGATYLRYKVF